MVISTKVLRSHPSSDGFLVTSDPDYALGVPYMLPRSRDLRVPSSDYSPRRRSRIRPSALVVGFWQRVQGTMIPWDVGNAV